MALYPPAVKRLIAPPASDPKITARVAILHVDANNATGEDLYRYFSSGSGGIESHFHIEKDGTVYQFRDTAYQADANWHANDFAVSIETQGVAAGEWTPAQLDSIKALLTWCHTTHGIPLVKCPTWDGSGVGYHILFMQEWAGGPRACPGPDRIRQFNDVLVPWMATGGSEEIPMAIADDILAEVRGLRKEEADRYKVDAGRYGDIVRRLDDVKAEIDKSEGDVVAAVKAAAPTVSDVDAGNIAKAVVDALAVRIAPVA